MYWSFSAPSQQENSVLEFLCSFTKRNFSVGVSLLLHKNEILLLEFLCSFAKRNFQCWSFFAPSQNEILLLEFLCSFAKRNFQCWSFFAPSQSILKTINSDRSAYLSLNSELIRGSRRGEFWAFQILAKTSQGSCKFKIHSCFRTEVRPRNPHTLIPKLALMDTG